MITIRTVALGLLGLMLSVQVLAAQSSAQYREFALGSDLASVSALAGVAVTEATIVHQRPAVMHDLRWRPLYSAATSPDPVQQIVFSFYNDQLFRVVIDYDRSRTEGMTDADMIDAITSEYGPQSRAPLASRPASSPIAQESGSRLAWWGDAGYSVVLYRSPYASGFRMIVTSLQLDALARTAEAQAIRMDERDAPRREAVRLKKEAAETRDAQEKARVVNKAGFRP